MLRQNPFFNRHRITDPAHFHGRQGELEQLFSAVLTAQCRAIVGERKVGKSSLLTYMARSEVQKGFGLDPERYLFSYLDMEGLVSATRSEFWEEVLDQIYGQLRQEDLRTRFRDDQGRGEIRFMRVRRLFRRLGDAGLRLVLLLDEFEALAQNPHFEPDFYGELRSLAGEIGVIYFTASKRSLYELTYRHSSTLSSPFFNIFSELPLGLLPPEQARGLLRQVSAVGGIDDPPPDLLEPALEWAGPHPFFLQIAAYYLWEAGAQQGKLSATAGDTAERRFLAEAEDHYRYLWAQLDESERSAVQQPQQAPEELLRRLQRRGVLRRRSKQESVSDRPTWQPFSTPFAAFAQRQQEATPTTPAIALPAGEDLTGHSVGSYRVLERCGQGGMADVYKGYHPLIDRYVAIKVLRPGLSDDEEFRTRFQREATAVANMRHPNIVQLYDFGQLGDRYYMVMEFVEGGSLRDRLQEMRSQDSSLPLGEVEAIVRGVAAALDYAHRRGIVHRDVKPANILFTREGDPVLTDFGIARLLRSNAVTMDGMSVGTPDYMSPEQGMGQPASLHSDIYSLGVVLYEMLVGRRPFTADTPFGVIVQHIQSQIPSPRGEDPAFPENLEHILERALAKEPQNRYASAGELARELELALEGRL
ncbi:MAG: protein kinase [Chloroflexia bacterium]|nr:protein kinase [Chloroflexia bacterium]